MAEKGILICKDSARRPSGEGYCVFADEEAALEALKKDNASMGHRLAWSEGLNISNPFRSIRLLFPFSYSSATACQSTVSQLQARYGVGGKDVGGCGRRGARYPGVGTLLHGLWRDGGASIGE